MKTLADMSPEERARCRGMWCDFPDPDERTNLAIYVDDSLKHQGFCELIHEGQLGRLTIPENLTPRFDLPRAWTPNGQPPAGKWEHAERLSMGVTTVYLCGKENPTHRQWIGDWEEA
ncbi:hypothetical protein [Corynebacterium accolens]|uniref:hypothetical protein n=1 Tax=Corynebacterium accolens TaxID=38284 RepID=UPI0025434224|nr:hypothetical protein [Corynebacterium accolens]MDK4338314.1 hypothetical protein [Corynebacterium accolens]